MIQNNPTGIVLIEGEIYCKGCIPEGADRSENSIIRIEHIYQPEIMCAACGVIHSFELKERS